MVILDSDNFKGWAFTSTPPPSQLGSAPRSPSSAPHFPVLISTKAQIIFWFQWWLGKKVRFHAVEDHEVSVADFFSEMAVSTVASSHLNHFRLLADLGHHCVGSCLFKHCMNGSGMGRVKQTVCFIMKAAFQQGDVRASFRTTESWRLHKIYDIWNIYFNLQGMFCIKRTVPRFKIRFFSLVRNIKGINT